jgi:uncharacterized protein YjiS (DUF1127 family)
LNALFVKAARELIAWIKTDRQSRGGINELTTLHDRLLADIGLSRTRIGHIRRNDRLRKHWYYDGCQ